MTLMQVRGECTKLGNAPPTPNGHLWYLPIEESRLEANKNQAPPVCAAQASEYRKLVVHFTINDLRFAEESVDARMAR